MTWLLLTKSSEGSASFTKRCRDLPSFRRMGGAHTRNSFPAGPRPAFPGSSRGRKEKRGPAEPDRGRGEEGGTEARPYRMHRNAVSSRRTWLVQQARR